MTDKIRVLTVKIRALINIGGYDVIVHGHTHEARAYRKGRTLIVNPGEACGYLSGKATIAVLETKEREVRVIRLK